MIRPVPAEAAPAEAVAAEAVAVEAVAVAATASKTQDTREYLFRRPQSSKTQENVFFVGRSLRLQRPPEKHFLAPII